MSQSCVFYKLRTIAHALVFGRVVQEMFPGKAVELASSVILFDEIDKLFEGGTYRDSYMARVEGDLLQL